MIVYHYNGCPLWGLSQACRLLMDFSCSFLKESVAPMRTRQCHASFSTTASALYHCCLLRVVRL
jgi:hypothetical protein